MFEYAELYGRDSAFYSQRKESTVAFFLNNAIAKVLSSSLIQRNILIASIQKKINIRANGNNLYLRALNRTIMYIHNVK